MKGKKMPMPSTVSPMLTTLVKAPTNDPDYVHEIKWDGYRIIAYKQKTNIRLHSRGGQNYTDKYSPVVAALKSLKSDVVLDGEVCVLDEEGIPTFDALQKFKDKGGNIVYYCFDLLWIDGFNVMNLPLLERKERLKQLLKDNKVIQYSDHFPDGIALYKQIKKLGLEGIVSKKKNALYKPGIRGNDWLKVPVKLRQEFVIGGWAESERGRSFRSILFGAYNDNGQLEWIGRSGGGYKEKDMPGIFKRLKSLEIKKSPFINKILDTKGAVIHYVKPTLVANFEFSGFTTSGRIRKPATWLGFRDDKNPKEVVREIAVDQEPVKRVHTKPARKKLPASVESNWPKVEAVKITNREKFNLGNCDIEIYNVERQIWKGITKADLLQYYHSIADYILPHLKSRPLSLHIKPVNAGAPGFYIKDMEGRHPECADIFTIERKHKVKGKRDIIDYLVCNNEETLLWMVNIGCIDINPWTSRISNHLQPDYIIIDLDPADDDFKKAIDTAQAAKQFFDKHKLKAFAKTSGKTGIHLYLPCRGFSFAEARNIAENICNGIHELVPDFTTTRVSKHLRGEKLYLDPNQNDKADTVAAPYSARPYHIPSVSTPLEWREIRPHLDPTDFTIYTIRMRLQKKGELFEDILDPSIAVKNNKGLRKWL